MSAEVEGPPLYFHLVQLDNISRYLVYHKSLMIPLEEDTLKLSAWT